MSEKASALIGKSPRSNGIAMAAAALLVAVAVGATAAAAPYVFNGAVLKDAIAAQLRTTAGLRIVASSRVSFALLPSPHVEMSDVQLDSIDKAFTIEAGALEGDIRLLPLVVGRLELASATLTRPKVSIDLDAGKMNADSTIGRALRGLAPAFGDAGARLGTVTLVDGTAVLKSKNLPHPPLLEDIDITLDWPDIASPATLTGSLTVDGAATDVAAWAARPSSLMRGETSPIALRIQAAPLDLSANGDLTQAQIVLFRGHMALTAPSLPSLLARFGIKMPHLAPFANAALTSDANVTIDHSDATTIDLPGLSLDIDGNHYDGTLAYESGTRPSLSGTLATDTLTLAPFLAGEPSLADSAHRWTKTALLVGRPNAVALDLRLSAAHLHVAPFTVDDAAILVMTRGDRTEIVLNEGRAYGGSLKARVSIGDPNNILSLRGAGTLGDADMAGISWDAFGRQVASGVLSGALNIETSGDSAATLMAHLQGWVKLRASGGELSGIDLDRSLHALDKQHPNGGLTSLYQGRTSFTNAALALRLNDGIGTLEDAVLQATPARASATGSIDLANRTLNVSAQASSSADSGTPQRQSFTADVTGGFDRPTVRLEPGFTAP